MQQNPRNPPSSGSLVREGQIVYLFVSKDTFDVEKSLLSIIKGIRSSISIVLKIVELIS